MPLLPQGARRIGHWPDRPARPRLTPREKFLFGFNPGGWLRKVG